MPTPRIHFAHRLLRARDWQDRPEFHQLCQWWRKLRDPESSAEINPHGEATRRALEQLEAGVLTTYPLEPRGERMKDFFVSYNGADRNWAEWIAWTLEEAGYSVVIQAWDFRPGGNFVLEMQKAADRTQKTIAVLSEEYLNAEYTQPEWAAAFVQDPRGEERKLIPIRVTPCSPTGLLKSILYVDVVGLAEEDARIAILGAFSERSKPDSPPAYPGAAPTRQPAASERVVPHRQEYPGVSQTRSVVQSLNLEQEAPLEHVRQSMTADERLELNRRLNSMPPQQFNMLVFAVNPPAGLVPPMPAPQADRSSAMLTWAEGPGGCGLTVIVEVVQKIVHP